LDVQPERLYNAPRAALAAERARLVRLCLGLTGDAQAAEDLAQETLLIALQQERTLRDPTKHAQWLSGIARNLCLHWTRRRGLERARSAQPHPRDDAQTSPLDELPSGAVDLDTDLERSELVALLDQALGLLPPETREALVRRYVQDLSHGDIAARLGTSEEAVKKRVERGKLALRRILATDLRQEALSYGLILPRDDGEQETRVWCPGCGRHRLVGRFRPEEGELYLRCPGCSRPGTQYMGARMGDLLQGLRTHKPALSRCLNVIDERFHQRLVDGATPCPGCGDLLPIRRGAPPDNQAPWPGDESIYLWCARCGLHNVESWHSLTWSLPEARRFWRVNPRMRFLPEREVEAAGSPAIMTGFESLTGGARLEVVTLRDTYRVVRIDGAPPRNARED